MRFLTGAAVMAGWMMLMACGPVSTPANAQQGGIPKLSAESKQAIGKKIWQNESGGTVSGLTAWNGGEDFPSLGIGHFIWYPEGVRGPFEESWPAFVKFAVERGADVPTVGRSRHSPWRTRAEFQAASDGAAMRGLRSWLASNVAVQTDFIVARSRAALPKIVRASPAGQAERVSANYRNVATTPQGVYALIDYVNFKGEGTNSAEQYKGSGWGLAQVLAEMKPTGDGPAAASEFAAAAKRVLGRRIQNSPPARNEAQWRAGWFSRCDTYGRPL